MNKCLAVLILNNIFFLGCTTLSSNLPDPNQSKEDGTNNSSDTNAVIVPSSDAGNDANLDASLVLDGSGGGGTENDVEIIPATPSIYFSGRFSSDQTTSSPGAEIIANFQGSAASVQLNLSANGSCFYDVLIDGVQVITALPLLTGTNSYQLATNLNKNISHTVELYRRSEAIYGEVQFLGFDFPSGKLLATPFTFSHKLEFLGDSLTAGFGVECTDPSQTNTAATQNEHKSFAALTSKLLNAEHYNLAYSGTGVYWNYDRTDPQVYGLDYPLLFPETYWTPINWKFSNYSPDVVWMMIGANDWDQSSLSDPPPPLAGFIAKYQQLVTFVRSNYPAAEIILAIPPDASADYPVGYNFLTNMRAALAAIIATQKSLDDQKVISFEFSPGDSTLDMTGCAGHPSAAKQASMAAEVASEIKSVMNW